MATKTQKGRKNPSTRLSNRDPGKAKANTTQEHKDWTFFCHLGIVTLGIYGKCLLNMGSATISTPSIKQQQKHYAKTASAPWRTIMSSRAGPVPTQPTGTPTNSPMNSM